MSTATRQTARAASSADVTPTQLWQRSRGPLAVALVVLVAALVATIAAAGRHGGSLDPRSASPSGSRAVATLLAEQGVTVTRVTRGADAVAAAEAGSTVLVVVPDLVVDSQVTALRDSGADLVLLAATDPGRYDDALAAVRPADTGRYDLDCRLRAAVRAGDVDAGGVLYKVQLDVGTDADLCYSRGGRPSLVQVRRGDRAVTVVGNPDILTNDRLDDRGNAALALGLLGARPRLVWYLPQLAEGGSGGASLYDLIPAGVWWALAQVAVAVVLLAFWRGRRLGPVVPEPLPVVVRAAETVEGRGRLYRRAGARDRSAAALRAGLLARVGPAAGLPRRAQPTEVVERLAARSGRAPAEVASLVYGAAPPTDDDLVRLAGELDRLEREVRRP